MSNELFLAVAGNAAAGGAAYVEDVFSTYLYTGVNSSQTITNGIALGGDDAKGGLVWLKRRAGGVGTAHHELFDTERGATKEIFSNLTNGEQTDTDTLTSFNADGFTLGADATINYSGDYASWTFAKQEKFFDVVTYTGNGSNQAISHNLGSVPGAVLVKKLDGATDWIMYHRGVDSSSPEDYGMRFNQTDNRDNDVFWNDTPPTSTTFTVGNKNATNQSGGSYVAYLFAHNDGDGIFGENGDQDIIKCGSFTASAGTEVDLGFEPQWILTKSATSSAEWYLFDNMRGWGADQGSNDAWLEANTSGAEYGLTNSLGLTPTGFTAFNGGGQTYIYIAIRRGPMKTPTSGTEVFAIDYATSTSTVPNFYSGFPVDMGIRKASVTSSDEHALSTRLLGDGWLLTPLTNAETSNSIVDFDHMDGWSLNKTSSSISWMFRRAPGFFDVVAYEGTSVAKTVAHNLGAVPELLITKRRDTVGNWNVYSSGIGASNRLILDQDSASSSSAVWNNTAPTSSVFSLGSNTGVNASGGDFIAYLFATLPGVSKVGSYTGNGTSQTIDCGFSAGARFFLVKASSTTGDWHVFDTERGIIAGNDPYLELNTTSAEDTDEDAVDPVSSGIIVNETSASNINTSGVTYIFMAVA